MTKRLWRLKKVHGVEKCVLLHTRTRCFRLIEAWALGYEDEAGHVLSEPGFEVRLDMTRKNAGHWEKLIGRRAKVWMPDHWIVPLGREDRPWVPDVERHLIPALSVIQHASRARFDPGIIARCLHHAWKTT